MRIVHIDAAAAATTVGGFLLGPGDSVDVWLTPGVGGNDEQIHFIVLHGRVAVTVSGRIRKLSTGDRATLPIRSLSPAR